MKGKGLLSCLALALLLAPPIQGARPSSSNMFSDVPRGHWAYESVKKAVEAGVLQGYDGKYQGNKTINRYQMAQIVARILERVGQGGDAGKSLTEQDLQNLEALTIEFADELALLNVKVSTLEDTVAELKHDMETVKTGGHFGRRHGPQNASAGLHGVAALRLVMTGEGGPDGAVGSAAGVHTPLTRYSGDVVGVATPQTYASKLFFTIPQLSLSVDRDIDEGIGVHLQVDLDADIGDNQNSGAGIATPVDLPGGVGGLQVNEAYIDVDDFFYGVGARMGTFALPISREHNGTHRTLDYTITPSAVSWRLETYRPIGIELRNQDEVVRWDWRLGIISGLDGPPAGAGVAGTFNLMNGMLFPGLAYATMKSTPFLANAPYTDVPQGLAATGTTGVEITGLGAYARVGDQPEQGFGWDLNFITNGGNIEPSTTKRFSATEFTAMVGSVDYYWKYFDIVVQAYSGQTKNTATTGQIINAAGDSVDSLGVYGLVNYRFDPDNSVTLRVEQNSDEVASIGLLEVSTITLGYSRVISDHSLFQLEMIMPSATYTAATPLVPPSAATNSTDQADELIQANYKLKW